MELQHKENGYKIIVAAKRGNIVVNRKGFVSIDRGHYHGCHMVSADVLEEKFEVVA